MLLKPPDVTKAPVPQPFVLPACVSLHAELPICPRVGIRLQSILTSVQLDRATAVWMRCAPTPLVDSSARARAGTSAMVSPAPVSRPIVVTYIYKPRNTKHTSSHFTKPAQNGAFGRFLVDCGPLWMHGFFVGHKVAACTALPHKVVQFLSSTLASRLWVNKCYMHVINDCTVQHNHMLLMHPAKSHTVDECTTGLSNCSVNADCYNLVPSALSTPGGFSCVCKQGFTGDGVTCTGESSAIMRGPRGISCPRPLLEPARASGCGWSTLG